MNLLSILSEEDTIMVDSAPEQPLNAVYFLPTLATSIQKDLLELVVEVFRPELQEIHRSRKQKTSIDSLLDNGSSDGIKSEISSGSNGNKTNSFTTADKLNLLFEQLRLIDRHPTLVVGHFIPRNYLLSDVNERMVNISGKFQLFNRVVDSFLDRYPLKNEEKTEKRSNFHMAVVASNVKELELIEGLIIGKKLYYRNLSAGRLYNDDRGYPKEGEETCSLTPDVEENESSNGLTIRGETWKRRKTNRHHNHKKAKFYNASNISEGPCSNIQPNENLCLHLITSQQIYNQNFDERINLIFSFDSELDVNNAGLELIRTSSSNRSLSSTDVLKTPIITPVSAFSLEHCLMKIPKSEVHTFATSNYSDMEKPDFKWKLKVINTFIANRHKLFSKEYENPKFFVDIYQNNFGKLFEWFHKWETMNYPLSHNYDEILRSQNLNINLNFQDSHLLKELNTNYFYDFGPRSNDKQSFKSINIEGNSIAFSTTFDYKKYKEHIALIIHERLDQLNNTINEKYYPALCSLRSHQSNVQNNMDEENEKIGENYRKLTKFNEQANISERKFAKVESDLIKYQQQEDELKNALKHLDEKLMTIVKTENGNELKALDASKFSTRLNSDYDFSINEQIHLIDELREELNLLTTELYRLDTEEDEMRSNYQLTSNNAVDLSAKVDRLKSMNGKIASKLHGPGSALLPSLGQKYELMNAETQLKKLKKTNEFMENLLNQKLNKVVAERTSVMESSGSMTSSRGSRMSRATTPF